MTLPARERSTALAALGLAEEATPAQVTAAYRRLARTTHPDLCPDQDAPARFAALTDAYRRAREDSPPERVAVTWSAPEPTASHEKPFIRLSASPAPQPRRQPDLIVGPVHVRPHARAGQPRQVEEESQ